MTQDTTLEKSSVAGPDSASATSVSDNAAGSSVWLHRFAVATACATFLLIIAGALVTATGSSLSVPDWPLSFGQFFPEMTGGVFYEHGHRMIAGTVGVMTLTLAVWLWLREPRRWVRMLGLAALIAVIIQAVLGGITVLYLLPAPISVAHATLAQVFLCITVVLAMATGPGWRRLHEAQVAPAERDDLVPLLCAAASVSIVLQLIAGAVMRHTGAGLAIPDFPLALGEVIPPLHSQLVLIHFLHRIGAVLVTGAIVIALVAIWRRHGARVELVTLAGALLALVLAQILLGGITVITLKAVTPSTIHIANGACILALSVILTVRAWVLLKPRAA